MGQRDRQGRFKREPQNAADIARSRGNPADIQGPYLPRGMDDHVLAPGQFADLIDGFEEGDDGALEPVVGPAPFVPDYGAGLPNYNAMHGIFHASVYRGGPRSILVAHSGVKIIAFEGWNGPTGNAWRTLVGPAVGWPAGAGQLTDALPSRQRPGSFPTQFEATPAGIIIVPQDARALFYDGEVVAPFGYSNRPPSMTKAWMQSNRDFSRDDGLGPPATEVGFFAHEPFTLGYTERTMNALTIAGNDQYGYLREGQIALTYQWTDRWGNLSPQAERLILKIPHEDSEYDTGLQLPWDLARVLKAAGAFGMTPGDGATIGRVVSRTKEPSSTGDVTMYEMVGAVPSAWATIPENNGHGVTINEHDLMLASPTLDVMPMPQFKLARMAIGRNWIGNVLDDQGIIIPSHPGLWGTLSPDEAMYPDPAGSEVTGMWPFQKGMLACTRSSTYLVMMNDKGGGFRADPVSRQYGCAAPSSMQTRHDGTPMWLAGDEFVEMTDKGVKPISNQIKRRLARMNTSRFSQAVAVTDPRTGEYRCWLPSGGSTDNDTCFVYRQGQWRERSGERLSAVCAIKDGSEQVLGAGQVRLGVSLEDGVWALDKQIPTHMGASRLYTFETVWFTRASELRKGSPQRVMFWLREENPDEISVAVYRDWREGVDVTDGTATVATWPKEDPPPRWGVTTLGAAASRWQRRRFFWTRRSIGAPACESFKIVLTSTSPFSIMGLALEGVARAARERLEGS